MNWLGISPRARRLIGLIILLLSLSLLIWGLWPFGQSTRSVPILPGEIQLPTPESLRLYPWLLA